MKLVKIAVIILGVAALAVVVAPSISGQARRVQVNPRSDDFPFGFGRGAQIGASVRDLEGTEVRDGGGVYVEDVTANGPAEQAGLKRGDIVTKWDGEAVRSVRQFTRLVEETPAGRAVQATVVRDGKNTDLKVTPSEGRRGRVFVDGDRLSADINDRVREQLERFRDRRAFGDFDFGFDFQGIVGGARLGVSVDDLTPQLATYFGAKDGVLVTSVVDDSPASRAGIKAGDVITAVNGQNVASRGDLLRSIRSNRTDTDVTIEIVRDKKTTTVKARLDDQRARQPGQRFARPVRGRAA